MATSTTSQTTRAGIALRVPGLVATAVAAVAMLASLLGLGWLHVPANPAVGAPETTLNFGDLHNVTSASLIPTTGFQQAYFAWLGWVLVIATVVLLAFAVVMRLRVMGIVTAGVATVTLVCTVFGVKGALTWSQLADQVQNIRIGGYVIVVGLVVALVGGLLGRSARP